MEKVEKKRKWEREYEKYSSSTELDERLEYLQDLINGKIATKEELDEHKKLTSIKTNLPKVKNILELRGKLEEQSKELKEEIARRELVEKYNKAAKLLEDEMKNLLEEKLSLEGQMKDPNLDPKKREELQTKLAENDKKREENNIKFGKCQEGIDAENKKTEQSQFKDLSTEELKDELIALKQKVSMCNYACNRLMQGYSWQSVEVALDKFQGEKLTAKGQQAAKMKQNRKAAPVKEQEEVQSKEAEKEAEPEKTEQEEVEQEEEEEVGLAEVSRWQKAKLWLAGIGSKVFNGVKNFVGKFRKEKMEEEIEEEEPTSDNQPKGNPWEKLYRRDDGQKVEEKEEVVEEQEEIVVEQEQEVAKQEVSKQDDFRKYLRDVAEKGVDGVEKEDKEARRQAAIRQLIENKRNARGDDGGTIAKLEAQLQDGDER